jgi:TonB family protein
MNNFKYSLSIPSFIISILLHLAIILIFIRPKYENKFPALIKKSFKNLIPLNVIAHSELKSHSSKNSDKSSPFSVTKIYNNPNNIFETTSALANESTISQSTESEIAFLNNESPIYPYMARKMNLEGTVELQITFNKDGIVSEVIILKSSGHKILDENAKKAAFLWRIKTSEELSLTKSITYQLKE